MASKINSELFKSIIKFTKSPGFHQCLSHIQITGVETGRCIAEFKVRSEDLNGVGGLHGGLVATVADNHPTYALVANNCAPGGTVDLHISYLKRAKEGDTVVIDSKTVKTGKSLAYLECELRNKDNDQIIAKASHTKYFP